MFDHTFNLASATRDQRYTQNVIPAPTCVRCSSRTISGGSSAAKSGGRLIAGMSASLTGCHVGMNRDMYPATNTRTHTYITGDLYIKRSLQIKRLRLPI